MKVSKVGMQLRYRWPLYTILFANANFNVVFTWPQITQCQEEPLTYNLKPKICTPGMLRA